MHRPLYSSSVHPSISSCINPPMHPPTKSLQVIQWTHQVPQWKTPLGFCWPETHSTTSNYRDTISALVNELNVGKRSWRSETEGQGGSKCQVPLGSQDGGYIYQSKQPRGAEYFTCRCGLLHYHIHQSHSVPFQPFTIQNSYNMQNAGHYKMLKCSRKQIFEEVLR